ncbi:MAG: HPr family phosphocarrier protein [Bacillota bacterium]
MAEDTVEIVNELGLHARPAALFVQQASKFKADIRILKDGREADGKSILDIMMLTARKGANIRIKADGEDAEAAVKALSHLVKSGFHEHLH